MVSAQRMLFISAALVIFIGIWLSGYNNVHWFLYVPVVLLTFAAVTGICPALLLWKKLGFK